MMPKVTPKGVLWILSCGLVVYLVYASFISNNVGDSPVGRNDYASGDHHKPRKTRRPVSKTNADVSNLAKHQDGKSDSKHMHKTGGPVKHIAFLKVHKTASSTAQNIFLRFGQSQNLTLILAHTKGESTWPNVISYTNTVTKNNVVPPPPEKTFDLLCCHVLYNRKQFESLLPSDTVYIGIVREPVSRFQSAIKFFGLRHIDQIQGKHPLSIYLNDPLKYEPSDPKKSFFNNRMAVEFGFPRELFPGKAKSNSSEALQNYIAKLDSEFDFIIISERFDESVVYMRRLLKWDLKDVLYMEQNKGQSSPNGRRLLTKEDKATLGTGSFLRLEIELYKFSVERFNKQIKAEGQDLQNELELFRRVRQRAIEFCKLKQSSLHIEKSRWNKAFDLTRQDCANFVKDEKLYIQMHRIRMYGTKDN